MEKVAPFADISDEELHQIEEMLVASRAKLVRKIERHNGAVIAPSDTK